MAGINITLNERIAKIETELVYIRSELKEIKDSIKDHFHLTERRLDGIDLWKAKMIGISTGASAIIAFAINIFLK